MNHVISIVDDDPAVIDSLKLLLETRGYETDSHASAAEFLRSDVQSACVITDVRMPGMSGIELLKDLIAKGDGRPVILLTGHGDIEMAVQAIKMGAFDFIEKPFDTGRLFNTIVQAIDSAAENHAEQVQHAVWRERYATLTERQRDTMCLLVQGMANKEIAVRLGISPRTVEIHRTWVMNKMAANTLAELVRMGIALKIS